MSKKYNNKEYERCVKDPVYFLTHYCGCIKKGDDVIMPLTLTKEQIEELHKCQSMT